MHADSWQDSFIVIEEEWKVRCDTNRISAEETCSKACDPFRSLSQGFLAQIIYSVLRC